MLEDRPKEKKGGQELKLRTIKEICLIIIKKEERGSNRVLTVGLK